MKIVIDIPLDPEADDNLVRSGAAMIQALLAKFISKTAESVTGLEMKVSIYDDNGELLSE